jgi:hypothetical protein
MPAWPPGHPGHKDPLWRMPSVPVTALREVGTFASTGACELLHKLAPTMLDVRLAGRGKGRRCDARHSI